MCAWLFCPRTSVFERLGPCLSPRLCVVRDPLICHNFRHLVPSIVPQLLPGLFTPPPPPSFPLDSLLISLLFSLSLGPHHFSRTLFHPSMPLISLDSASLTASAVHSLPAVFLPSVPPHQKFFGPCSGGLTPSLSLSLPPPLASTMRDCENHAGPCRI